MSGTIKFAGNAGKNRKTSGSVQFGMHADYTNIRTESEIWNRECPGHRIASVYDFP